MTATLGTYQSYQHRAGFAEASPSAVPPKTTSRILPTWPGLSENPAPSATAEDTAAYIHANTTRDPGHRHLRRPRMTTTIRARL
ncbi:hypothetical protein MY4824_007110 [Beauveria thailandica]